ncbi:hypothetical protein [Vibrio sp. TBV020]|uniref:hypothetical protein n=1 Tax=Vibrio sp. TBV020 TaxID=3137398 RepID=UPI0038CDAD39
MTQQQFELIKQQIKQLSTHQLHTLKSEINSELGSDNTVNITDEEQEMISSLFA